MMQSQGYLIIILISIANINSSIFYRLLYAKVCGV